MGLNYRGEEVHKGVVEDILTRLHGEGHYWVTSNQIYDEYQKTPLPGPIEHMTQRGLANHLSRMGDEDLIDRYIISHGREGRTSYMRLKSLGSVPDKKPPRAVIAGSPLSGRIVSAARRSIAEGEPEKGISEILELVGAK